MLVSIGIPFYNAASTLERSIKSVLNQTVQNWELLLIDDGSIDNSLSVCQRYAERDTRIKIFSGDHKGVGAARNLIVNNAEGVKLCFLDADDFYEPNYLESLLTCNNAELIVCGYSVDRYDSDDKLINREIHSPDELNIKSIEERFKLENAFASGIMCYLWNKLFDIDIIRKNCIQFEKYPVNEDYIFVLEYLKYISSVSVIPDSLYHWVRINGNLTAVESIPTNILQIYEHSHTLLADYLRNDKLAARIAYRSYELIIFKYLQQYNAGNLTKEHCFSSLSSFHKSELVKHAFDSYKPTAPFEKILYYINKKGLFRITYTCMQLLSVFK